MASQSNSRSYSVGQKHPKITEAMRGCCQGSSCQQQVIAAPSPTDGQCYTVCKRLRFEDVNLPLLRKREVCQSVTGSFSDRVSVAYNTIIRRAETRAQN